MASIIESIKAKVDVVEEIGLVVALHKSGKSLKGLCPFHNERTPSFYVFPEAQTWHCFGCNEGGDVFTFVEKQQGLEFREALLYLAEKAGVSVEEIGSQHAEEDRATSAQKERLRKLNEDALLWFHQMLLRAKEAEVARAYVQSRGISTETVIAFGLGYAPERWDSLTRYLLNLGYSERELVSGGLAREREGVGADAAGSTGGMGHGVYDYFRNRLIFPIRDIRGRVIGFGGRGLGNDKPKYMNSPQTLLFEKNSVLYALDMARDAIKQAGQVVIVEGYVDAVIAHQYGTKQTVACIGSAITAKHIQQLKKLTKQVTLALDPDAAGSAATEHGIQEAMKGFDRTIVPVPLAGGSDGRHEHNSRNGHNAKSSLGIVRLEEQVDAEINVVQLPEGEDPDELIRRDFSAWLYAIAHPLPLIDYYFAVKTVQLNLREPAGKTEAARRLLPVIATISDRVKRDVYLRKLAMMISVDERTLYEELKRVLRGQGTAGVTAVFSEEAAPRSLRRTRRQPDVAEPREGDVTADVQSPTANRLMEANGSAEGLDRESTDKLQWEDYLIGLLLLNPGVNADVCGIINDGDFIGTDTRELYRILSSMYQRGFSPSQQSIAQAVPSALLATVARAQACAESLSPLDGAGRVKAAVQCATRLKRTRLLQLNSELVYLEQEARRVGDTAQARLLRSQMRVIHQQRRTLDSSTPLQG
jgi:DNA primase